MQTDGVRACTRRSNRHPLPVTGTWKSTYTSGGHTGTQSHTLHGEVQAYDASYRQSTVPGGEHPAGDGCTMQVMSITWGNGQPVRVDPWQPGAKQITEVAPNCGLMSPQQAAAAYWTACTSPASTDKNWPVIFAGGDLPLFVVLRQPLKQVKYLSGPGEIDQ